MTQSPSFPQTGGPWQTASQFYQTAQPELPPALDAGLSKFLAGIGDPDRQGTGSFRKSLRDAARNFAKAFAKTDAGKKLGSDAAQNIALYLDEIVKRPEIASKWGSLAKFSSDPENFAKLSQSLTKVLGSEVGKQTGDFAHKLLSTVTTRGFGEAFTLIGKEGSKVAGALSKFGKFLPGVGLVISLLQAGKVFSNRRSTGAQRFAAVLNVVGGVAGLVPGIGTGAQVGIAAGTTAITLAADAEAKLDSFAGASPKSPVKLEDDLGDKRKVAQAPIRPGGGPWE